MKINYALMSCDENPLYKDFIPVITEAWNKMGIKPVFGVISDNEEGFEIDDKASLYYFKKIEGISIPFQALNARIWLWKLIYGNAILSDIDMMPLSSNYFNGTANIYKYDEIVSYCDDAIEKFGQIASCYILANSKVMSKLIVENTWEEFIKNRASETGQGWGGDQWYLGELLKKYNKVYRLKRGWNEAGQADHRIDRDHWVYKEELVEHGNYYDAHLLRPYSQHKVEIDKLLSLIP